MMKRIILLDFKRTSDTSETYYWDMKEIAERKHAPILKDLNALAEDGGWLVEVLPLVAGQMLVRETECLYVRLLVSHLGQSASEGH